MGVNLTPIIPRREMELGQLQGHSFALDASIEIYQFLALVRKPNGEPLKDSAGRITSHLVGFLSRSTRLISDYGMKLIYVFDGEPHPLKRRVLRERKEARQKAYEEWKYLVNVGDFRKAWSKAVVSSVLTSEMVDDAKTLLSLMGIPYVDAPSDAEAQAAFYAGNGVVWACGSKDYDSILYGADRLVRYLTIQGSEYLPSKGISRRLKPELIELDFVSRRLGLRREQIVDLAIIMGTDFNEGVEGVGPKKALSLLKKFGSIENLPEVVRKRVDPNFEQIRGIFLNPRVLTLQPPAPREIDEGGTLDFLVNQRNFNRERVLSAIQRLRKAQSRTPQESLSKYLS